MELEFFLDNLEEHIKINQTIGIKELDEYILNNSPLNIIFYDNKDNLNLSSLIHYDLRECDFLENTILDIDYMSLSNLSRTNIREIYEKLLNNKTSLTFLVKTPVELENQTKDLHYKFKNLDLMRMLSFCAKYEKENIFLIKSRFTNKGKIKILRENLFENKYNIFENDKLELALFYLMIEKIKLGKKIHYYTTQKQEQFLLKISNLILNKRSTNKYFNQEEKEKLKKYSNQIINYNENQIDIENMFISDISNFIYEYPNYKIKDETLTISLVNRLQESQSLPGKAKEGNDLISLFMKSEKKLKDSIWSLEYGSNGKIIFESNNTKFSLLRNFNDNLSYSVYGPINVEPKFVNNWYIRYEKNNDYFLYNHNGFFQKTICKIKTFDCENKIILGVDGRKYKLGEIDKDFLEKCIEKQVTLRSLEHKINKFPTD